MSILDKDFYGYSILPFIGVVKDVDDPLRSNRVRVAIMGIHPHELITSGVTPSNIAPGGTGSGGSGGSSTGGATGGGADMGQLQVDESKLPSSASLNQKLDDTDFTLAMLTTGVTGPASRRSAIEGINQGKLTPEIIKNLALLAKNALQPIRQKYGPFTITSGWRLGIGAAGNHPRGYAADIQVPGQSAYELASWINANCRGRFSMLLLEYAGQGKGWVHVQLGGKGSPSSPIIQTMVNHRTIGGGLQRVK